MTRFLAFFLLAMSLGYSQGAISKLSPDLVTGDADEVDVIVQFRESAPEQRAEKIRGRRGAVKGNFGHVRAAAARMKKADLKTLAQDPDVMYISPDRPVAAFLDNAAQATQASIAWSWGYNGRSVGVAIIDSGIRSQTDLQESTGSRVVYQENFVPGATDASDGFGHGSHIGGIVAGNGNNSTGGKFFRTFRGVAPGANLINLRVLDNNGAGTESSVIAAIERAIQIRSQYNIRVINLSLGRPVYESFRVDPLCRAVEAAWRAGIVVVVAAGNNGRDNTHGTKGYGTITSPGNHPLVITVGAMKTMGTPSRSDDHIASYSSKGPTLLDHVVKPDIVAPGNKLVSLPSTRGSLQNKYSSNTVPLQYYAKVGNNHTARDYFWLSGTSMATASVSGGVALLLQKEPHLTPDQVKARLMKTAYKGFPASSVATDPVTKESFYSQYDIFTIGAGYMDLAAALASNEVAPAGVQALSPTAVYDPATRSVYLKDQSALWGYSSLWGTSALWGHSAVWGTSVFVNSTSSLSGTAALWGSSAVWGTSSVSGFSALWGHSALWGWTADVAGERIDIAIQGE